MERETERETEGSGWKDLRLIAHMGQAPRAGKGEYLRLGLDLLARNGADRRENVVIKVVLFLVRIAASARHRLGRQTSAAEDRRRRGGDLGVGPAPARSADAGVDARHTEAIRAREGSGKAVALVVLGWRRGLAVCRLLCVTQVGGEAIYLLFAATRL